MGQQLDFWPAPGACTRQTGFFVSTHHPGAVIFTSPHSPSFFVAIKGSAAEAKACAEALNLAAGHDVKDVTCSKY